MSLRNLRFLQNLLIFSFSLYFGLIESKVIPKALLRNDQLNFFSKKGQGVLVSLAFFLSMHVLNQA